MCHVSVFSVVSVILLIGSIGCGGSKPAAKNAPPSPTNSPSGTEPATVSGTGKSSKPEASAGGSATEITARELAAKAVSSGPSFSTSYKGKRIKIRGEVGKIEGDVVSIGGEFTGDNILIVTMTMRDPADLKALIPWTPVTIEGELTSAEPGSPILAFRDATLVGKQSATPLPATVSITSEELAKEYLYSKPAEKYKDVKLKVTGPVESVSVAGKLVTLTAFKSEAGSTTVDMFCEGDVPDTVKPGDKVTLEGVIDGSEEMAMRCKNCKVVSAK